jgi:hypothetical protein
MSEYTLRSTKKNTLYRTWIGMKSRCNPDNKYGRRYWARGITVCDRWKDFDNFLEDMSDSYKEGLTLDRIDNNGSYEPENCRWATQKQQQNNKSSNKLVTYKGQTKTLAQWRDMADCKPSTFDNRYHVYGWSLERCFIKPTQTQRIK